DVYKRQESNRKERRCISEGNSLYNDGRYRAAMAKYQEALKMNPNSAAGRYNLGLSQIRLGTNPSDTSHAAKDMLKEGLSQMELVSKMGSERPQLAARANYNLGNVAFDSEDYENALNFYKQSLRLNPDDASAKRNLRITQLKLQDKNKDKNKDKDQDKNQDQNKNQNKDQNQNKPQNQNQDQNQDNKQDKRQQPDINQQTADQILKAMENKENQTRARVNAGNQGDKSSGGNRSRKNW
ncbi:MAG: tetratricopeptide repeat protein, partial [Muribaculaceae bacterium]|nr:tetratricopeptide repeat protein [Muribaculaceae bacterium]